MLEIVLAFYSLPPQTLKTVISEFSSSSLFFISRISSSLFPNSPFVQALPARRRLYTVLSSLDVSRKLRSDSLEEQADTHGDSPLMFPNFVDYGKFPAFSPRPLEPMSGVVSCK